MVNGINSRTGGVVPSQGATSQAKQAEEKTTTKTTAVDRVAELKKQIESGEYKINTRATAEKIAESLL